MHGRGDADGAVLVTEEVDYVESYIKRMGHSPTHCFNYINWSKTETD